MRRWVTTFILVLLGVIASDGQGRAAAPGADIPATPHSASTAIHHWITCGTYTGNALGQVVVSGLGFTPDLVLVRGEIDAPTDLKTSSMGTNNSKLLGVNTALIVNGIRTIQADGFTVGNSPSVNTVDLTYYWVACHAEPGVLHVGSYIGDGTDDRSITGVGFEPSYVIVMSAEGKEAFQRFADQDPNKSIEFSNSSDDDNRIQGFEPDGFQVGKDDAVNKATVIYHYVAFANTPGLVQVASYTGNDEDDRTMDVLGFEPEFVLIKQDGGESGVQRLAPMTGDVTYESHRNLAFPDGIQGLTSTGFQLGTDHSVNDGGKTYFYIALANSPNEPPALDPIDAQQVDQGQNLNFDVTATDADGDSIILTATGLPANATFLDHGNGTATFDFNPDFTQSGTVIVTFFASDERDTDSLSVSITIVTANQPPVWSQTGPQTVDEGASLTFNVRATDDDGDPLTLTAEDLPANAAFTDQGGGKGKVEFLPDFTQAGSYSIRFIASDGDLADTLIVLVTVNGVGSPPVLDAIGPQVVDEGQNLNFTVSATDPDGTEPLLTAEDLPVNSSFLDAGDGTGTFEFNPDYSQAGSYVVRFLASDGALADTEDVAITVVNVNRPPVLDALSDKTVGVGQYLDFNVLATDPDGTLPALTATGVPAGALFTDHGDGSATFEFTPTLEQLGLHAVVFIASDGDLTDTVTITIQVNAVNLPPVLAPIGAQTVREGDELTFDVSAVDPELTVPILTALNCPANAAFVDHDDGTGAFAFIPSFVQAGSYDVTFIASDGSLADSETVTITVVEAGNQAPILAAVDSQFVAEGEHLSVPISAIDPDETIPTLHAEDVPLNASFVAAMDGTGTIHFNPDYTQAGVYHVRVIASDGALADSAVIVITVSNVNRAPVLASIGPQVVEAGHTLNLGISATDPDGTIPSFTVEDVPLNATFADHLDGTATFDFDPDPAQVGIHAIRFIASDGTLADTELVSVTVSLAPVSYLAVTPDSVETAAGSFVNFVATAYDSTGTPTYAGEIVWTLTEPVGTMNASGMLSATTAGEARVVATSNLGAADTTAYLKVTAGPLAVLTVSPDSAAVPPQGAKKFSAIGEDAYGNSAELGTLTWTVIGDVGDIDTSGLFTATSSGVGRIAATSSIGGVTDTNRAIVVFAEGLFRLVVAPDTASLKTGESVTFTATGFDANSLPTDVGTLTWKVQGGIGTIDAGGRFTADHLGAGQITATSSINSVSGKSGTVVVDVLVASEIPLGNQIVHANQEPAPVLGLAVTNRFDTPKSVSGVVLRNGSTGAGTSAELRSDVASVAIYHDADDDLALSAADELLAQTVFTDNTALSFSPVTIGAASSQAFFAALTVAAQPHDGDSLDVYVLTASDIQTGDGQPAAGPERINSLGRCIVDGLVSNQIALYPPDSTRIVSQTGFQSALTIDIPRNGYKSDTLGILSVYNAGTATRDDLDSLALFQDDGDGVWRGSTAETFRGAMLYTGGQWQVSGIAVPLSTPVTRFYAAAIPSQFAAKGATLRLGIPLHGVEMYSANDGPLDAPVAPVATVSIVTTQSVHVEAVPIAPRTLVPGRRTGPLLGLSLVNGLGRNVVLDSLLLSLVASDPAGATNAQLAGQVDSVFLWQKAGYDFSTLAPEDSLLWAGILQDGAATVTTNGLEITSNAGEIRLVAGIRLSKTKSKNGNLIDLELGSGSDLFFASSPAVSGDFPVSNPGDFAIDAFPAACVDVFAVSGQTLVGGETHRLLFDFALPRNGYSPDALTTLRLHNKGTLDGQNGIEALTLWADAGAEGFSDNETRVGDFSYAGGEWVLSGIADPLSNVTTRFFLTVDIADETFDGATVQFEIPVGGATYASGTTGPDDAPVGNGTVHLLLPANRITAVALPESDATIAPGSAASMVMAFALYNGYISSTKTLQSVKFTNTSYSRSPGDFADRELGQVALFTDGNHDRLLSADTLIASGHFADGELRFSGLNVPLPPESLSYFVVSADVPLEMIDGDSLSIAISNYSDFEFGETVRLNGDIPVSSGGALIVDGSVAAQYELYGQPPSILSPGNDEVPLLAFRPAVNGDRPDTLLTVSVSDLEENGGGVIDALSLWLDEDGDGSRDASDLFLSELHPQGNGWISDPIWLEVAAPTPSLLVCATVAETAPTGSRVRLAIPVLGCSYASDNDGPRDHVLASPGISTVSTAALRASYAGLNTTYTVGQRVALKIGVANAALAAIDGVFPEIASLTGSDHLTLDSTRTAPRMLSPGDSAEYAFFYTATAPGTVHWQVRARATGSSDSSLVLQTNPVTIQSAPQAAIVGLINSIPTAVTRGLDNVFPLTIVVEHPDASPRSAMLRLDQITLNVWCSSCENADLSTIADRLVLSSGSTNLVVVEDVPAQSAVTLTFAQPVYVAPGSKRFISLLLDIADNASAIDFMLGIADADGITIEDANTLQTVPLVPQVVFPMQTAVCRIYEAAQALAVSSVSLARPTVNYGQDDAPFLRLRVRHPAQTGSSQIQLTGVSCEFVDQDGASIAPFALLERARITRGRIVLGEAAALAPDSLRLHITLTSPLTLNAGESDSLQLRVSLRPQAPIAGFAAVIRDSTAFVVRDLSSGSLLAAESDPEILPQGTVFPMMSAVSSLRRPASDLDICMLPMLPASVVGGQDSTVLIAMPIRYEAAADYSDIVIRSLQVAVIDSLSSFLDPRALFHEIGFRVTGQPVIYQSVFDVFQGAALFTFGDEGLRLRGGDETTLEILARIETTVPFDHFALAVWDDFAFDISDISDSLRRPPLHAMPSCQEIFPMISGVVSVVLPAGAPVLTPVTTGTHVGFPGAADVPVFEAQFDYESPQPQGDLRLQGLHGYLFRRDGSTDVPVLAADLFKELRLKWNDATAGTAFDDGSNAIGFVLGPGVSISRGTNAAISVVGDIAEGAAEGNYFVRFDDASFVSIVDENLATTIDPKITNASYPFESAELSVTGMNLERSFSNYPNPFNPTIGEATTIAYVLDQDANVDIRVFTLTGEEVATIAAHEARAAGAYQSDRWSGRNDASHMVVPGTYFCRITARYASGAVETYRRKIAVVR